MSSGFIVLLLLSFLTGSPFTALLVVLVLWFVSDRFTFRLFPDPLRALSRAGRRAELFAVIRRNPSDRRARFELAELCLEGHRPSLGLTVLRPNLEAGDDDVHTAFLYGALLSRAGEKDKAVRILEIARERDPGYRLGEIDLELGRAKLAANDFVGAKAALERLVAVRPGTVEGRWFLSRALFELGDAAGATRVKNEAFGEYLALPRFRRSHERPFAWRARPSRPIAVAVALLVALGLILAVAQGSAGPQRPQRAQIVRDL